MSHLISFIQLLLEGRALLFFSRAVIKKGVWLGVLAGIGFALLLVGLAFAGIASFEIAQTRMRPEMASAAVAAGAFVLMLLVALAIYLTLNPPRSRKRSTSSIAGETLGLALSAAPLAVTELGRGIKRRAPSLVIASLCVGFISGVVLFNRRR